MRRLLGCCAVILVSLAAIAQDIPTRRPGLWELTTTTENGFPPTSTVQLCIDLETDKLLRLEFAGDFGTEFCTWQPVRNVGETIVMDASCQLGDTKITIHSVTSGDFNTSYTTKVTSKVEGAPNVAQWLNGTKTIEGRFSGPCKPDQRPGDLVIGGKRFNAIELIKTTKQARELVIRELMKKK